MRLPRKAPELPADTAAAVIGGGLASFAFFPAGNCLFLFAGLAVFLHLVSRALSAKRTAVLGFLWGLGFFVPGVSWTYHSMHEVAGLPAAISGGGVLILAAALAIAPAAAAFAGRLFPVGRAARIAVVLPVLWASSEWVRGVVFGFGWLTAGYALSSTIFASWAPLLGVYGVSLAGMLLAGGALAAWTEKTGIWSRALPLLLFGAVAVGSWALGPLSWSEPSRRIEVRLVQPDLPVAMRFTLADQETRLERMLAMSVRAPSGRSPDLIVWPESVYVGVLRRLPAAMARVPAEAAGRTEAEVLFNAFHEAKPGEYANSFWFAAPGKLEVEPVYSKRHLVPMGEYVLPGLRWFIDLMGIPMHDQAAGSVPEGPLTLAGVPAALGICYENMFGEEWRDWWSGEGEGPGVFILAANLGWFSPYFTHQFTQMSVMRAREFSRPVLQAVNNSGSAYIASSGSIERMASPGAMCLDASVRTAKGPPTPFARFGHAALLFLMFLHLAAAFGTGWLSRRSQKGKSLEKQ